MNFFQSSDLRPQKQIGRYLCTVHFTLEPFIVTGILTSYLKQRHRPKISNPIRRLEMDTSAGGIGDAFVNVSLSSQMVDVMSKLKSSPLVDIRTVGQTHESRNISLVAISRNASEEKPIIFINCGIHAREWIAPAVCVWMIHQLIAPDVDDVLLDTFDWWIVPLANPDGYVYTWSHVSH